jgi:hypothetical protein
MSFTVDQWDCIAGVGFVLLAVGLGWFSVPLLLAAIGAALVVLGIHRSRYLVGRPSPGAVRAEDAD